MPHSVIETPRGVTNPADVPSHTNLGFRRRLCWHAFRGEGKSIREPDAHAGFADDLHVTRHLSPRAKGQRVRSRHRRGPDVDDDFGAGLSCHDRGRIGGNAGGGVEQFDLRGAGKKRRPIEDQRAGRGPLFGNGELAVLCSKFCHRRQCVRTMQRMVETTSRVCFCPNLSRNSTCPCA